MQYDKKMMQGNEIEEKSDDSSSDVSMSDSSDSSDLSDLSDNEDQASAANPIDMEANDIPRTADGPVEIISRDNPPSIKLDDVLADICFHPQNDLIALASVTGDIFMYKYNNESTELTTTLELHERACRDIEFSEDGNLLYSAGKDKNIMLTDVNTEKLTRIFEEAHEVPIYCMTVIDENTFATGDDDGVVKLWDLRQRSDTPVFSLKKMEDFVSAMITNDDKKFLVCSSGDGTLATFNLRGKKLHVQTEDYPQELTCLGLFKHGRKILTAGSKGNMFLFNWGEFGLHSDEIPSLTKKSINCMVPITENIVVTGGEDRMLRATNLFPNKQLGIVGQHNLSIECLDICNDGSIIASYSYDNDVKFWNVKYFETLNHTNVVKGGKQKVMKHNLPSSEFQNASDFFAEL